MIESFIEGRIRIRDSRLKDPEQALVCQSLLQAVDGVEGISINPKTGSLLVTYDRTKIPGSRIEELAVQMGFAPAGSTHDLLAAEKGATHSPRPARKKFTRRQRALVRYGLLASLVTTTVFAYTNRPLHHVTGLAFLGFALTHLTMYRKTFLK